MQMRVPTLIEQYSLGHCPPLPESYEERLDLVIRWFQRGLHLVQVGYGRFAPDLRKNLPFSIPGWVLEMDPDNLPSAMRSHFVHCLERWDEGVWQMFMASMYDFGKDGLRDHSVVEHFLVGVYPMRTGQCITAITDPVGLGKNLIARELWVAETNQIEAWKAEGKDPAEEWRRIDAEKLKPKFARGIVEDDAEAARIRAEHQRALATWEKNITVAQEKWHACIRERDLAKSRVNTGKGRPRLAFKDGLTDEEKAEANRIRDELCERRNAIAQEWTEMRIKYFTDQPVVNETSSDYDDWCVKTDEARAYLQSVKKVPKPKLKDFK